ncbi:Dipeptide transport system permease protein DppC [Clostridiaceae bacterium JG1575]|nr:Dipeptide transport system permease protein DppC [Clostridiaceae bacterium JG1575]
MSGVFRSTNFCIGAVLTGSLFLLMLLSFFYLPYDPGAMDLQLILAPPSGAHLLGTDHFGRDLLSRLMVGGQVAFAVGFFTVLFGLLVGLLLGSFSGYFGGWVDVVLMKVIDAQMAFPGVLLALMLIAVFGTGMRNTILALGIMSVPRFTRIIRAGYIKHRDDAFIQAARLRGAGPLRIMYRHILPNLVNPIAVTIATSFAGAVLSEAGLSYLGLGVQAPNPSWGRMLNEAQGYIFTQPLYAVIPGVVLTLLVLGFHLMADGVRIRAESEP